MIGSNSSISNNSHSQHRMRYSLIHMTWYIFLVFLSFMRLLCDVYKFYMNSQVLVSVVELKRIRFLFSRIDCSDIMASRANLFGGIFARSTHPVLHWAISTRRRRRAMGETEGQENELRSQCILYKRSNDGNRRNPREYGTKKTQQKSKSSNKILYFPSNSFIVLYMQ